jgi:hypothetical protein
MQAMFYRTCWGRTIGKKNRVGKAISNKTFTFFSMHDTLWRAGKKTQAVVWWRRK